MVVAVTIGLFVAVKIISDHTKTRKKQMKAIHFYSISFAVLLLVCGLLSYFIPIYFALVGIQLNVINGFSFLRFAIFFVIAFGLEAAGTLLMLVFTNSTTASKINFAVTMNARGGPGIVLATVAYANGIISLEFFTVLTKADKK